MACYNGSPGKSSERSDDWNLEWPPLESVNSAGCPKSLKGKPHHVNNGSATNQQKDRQRCEGLQVDVRVKSRWQDRRYNIPPRMMNKSGTPNLSEEKSQQVNNGGARNRTKDKQRGEVLQVDVRVEGRRQNRRYNIPPRMMNHKLGRPFGRNHNQNFNNRCALTADAPIDQQVPPILPPTTPCVQSTQALPSNLPNPSQTMYFDRCNVVLNPEVASISNNEMCEPKPPAPPSTSTRPSRPIREIKEKNDYWKFHVKRQIEFFFKPNKLDKDSFMKSNMDADGFVPISLIETFPKVREIASKRHIIMEALQMSDILEVVGEKVRSKEILNTWPIPNCGAINQAEPVTDPPGFPAFNLGAFPPAAFYPPSFGTYNFTQQAYLSNNNTPVFQRNNNFPSGSNGVYLPMINPPSMCSVSTQHVSNQCPPPSAHQNCVPVGSLTGWSYVPVLQSQNFSSGNNEVSPSMIHPSGIHANLIQCAPPSGLPENCIPQFYLCNSYIPALQSNNFPPGNNGVYPSVIQLPSMSKNPIQLPPSSNHQPE